MLTFTRFTERGPIAKRVPDNSSAALRCAPLHLDLKKGHRSKQHSRRDKEAHSSIKVPREWSRVLSGCYGGRKLEKSWDVYHLSTGDSDFATIHSMSCHSCHGTSILVSGCFRGWVFPCQNSGYRNDGCHIWGS